MDERPDGGGCPSPAPSCACDDCKLDLLFDRLLEVVPYAIAALAGASPPLAKLVESMSAEQYEGLLAMASPEQGARLAELLNKANRTVVQAGRRMTPFDGLSQAQVRTMTALAGPAQCARLRELWLRADRGELVELIIEAPSGDAEVHHG